MGKTGEGTATDVVVGMTGVGTTTVGVAAEQADRANRAVETKRKIKKLLI